jgi:Domain of unknown function (DUF4410)
MKLTPYQKIPLVTVAMAAAIFVAGCASSSNSSNPTTVAAQVPALPANITLHKDKDIQGVWLAPGFNFKGYDVLSIGETDFKAVERSNEVKERAAAMIAVQSQLVATISATKLFSTVTTNELPAGTHGLKLTNTIIEYEKGGGAARYFAGLYGAGQPVIKVRGQFFDGGKLVCVYEIRRSGESGGARMFGGFMGDLGIQANDIRDLAVDLADFMKRTAGN